jgi:isopenicillin-N epimerase
MWVDHFQGVRPADFVGLTCQKWIGAPIGVGIMYVRRERIGDIEVAMGDGQRLSTRLDDRVHTGTSDYAAPLAVEDALDFHERLGVRNKEARLRFLRDRWAEAARDHGRIEVLTPTDPRLTCALGSFRLRGAPSEVENRALAAELMRRFNIFTVERSGLASGACVRVTPGVFTRTAEVDLLARSLRTLA